MKYILSFLVLYFFYFLFTCGLLEVASIVPKWNSKYVTNLNFTVVNPGIYFLNNCSKLDYDYSLKKECDERYKSGILIYSFIKIVPHTQFYNKCFIVFNFSKAFTLYGISYLKLLLLREVGYCLGLSTIEEENSIMQKNIPLDFQWHNELKDKAILQQILDGKENGFIQTDEDDKPIFPLPEIQKFYFLL